MLFPSSDERNLPMKPLKKLLFLLLIVALLLPGTTLSVLGGRFRLLYWGDGSAGKI